MKRICIALLATLIGSGAAAQTVKSRPLDSADAIAVLEASGHHLFSFDLSQLLDQTYNITIYCKEYGAENPKDESHDMGANRLFVTDYPKEQYQMIMDEYNLKSEDEPIFCAEQLGIYVIPKNDSTMRVNLSLKDRGSIGMVLKLKAQHGGNTTLYSYHARPFTIPEFKEGADISLVLLGSSWFNSRANIFRFCGESEIAPDLSSEILQNIPHYYVLGIRLTKK